MLSVSEVWLGMHLGRQRMLGIISPTQGSTRDLFDIRILNIFLAVLPCQLLHSISWHNCTDTSSKVGVRSPIIGVNGAVVNVSASHARGRASTAALLFLTEVFGL